MITPYFLQDEPDGLRLTLGAALSVEHARPLHGELVDRCSPEVHLVIDAGATEHLDAAILQLLWAAARACRSARVATASTPWTQALARYGICWPPNPSSPHDHAQDHPDRG